MTMAAVTERRTRLNRVVSQGALLLAAFAAGQAMSLARNALLGHWLSKGDFGVAATITLALQLVEVLSDFGVDRHVVQSSDGDDPGLQASAHALLAGRGVLIALTLYLCAQPIAGFFHIEEAAWAFQIAALSPLVRGFCHLDVRRFQRQYDNRAFTLLEVLPQAAALVLMLPMLNWIGGYQAVAVVLVVQASIAWALSLALAERAYRLQFDPAFIRRLMSFGWPIWLSAFPLVAVYQGERVLVGRMFGVEALAAFTVAFMVTMVPGLAAAKIGHALMLPLLSEVRGQPQRYVRRVRVLSEATTLAAAIYATLFLIAGETLIPIAFGSAYRGLGLLAGCLAVMWALRMIQAVPGMVLMSVGVTRPLLVAGLLRALSLPVALALAVNGASLPVVASASIAGEAASLIYVSWATGQEVAGIDGILLRRSLFLLPAGLTAAVMAGAMPTDAGAILASAVVMGLSSALTMAACAVMPGLRRYIDLRRLKLIRARRVASI